MIANLIGGFVAIIVGVSLIGPIATSINTVAAAPIVNASNTSQVLTAAGSVYSSSTWGAAVLQLVPGFFALGVLGVGIAVTYSSLRQAGIV